jgi:hypothetical protein
MGLALPCHYRNWKLSKGNFWIPHFFVKKILAHGHDAQLSYLQMSVALNQQMQKYAFTPMMVECIVLQ